MSFQDSAFIFFIALLLFGPKKLPELARQLGKLMGEFRRASNDFRMQLEDELRTSEQAEKQKQIAALEAAKPLGPVASAAEAASGGAGELSQTPMLPIVSESAPSSALEPSLEQAATPIASAGTLELHPPTTGLPISRSGGVGQLFNELPEAPPDRSLSANLQVSDPHPPQPDQQEPAHHG